MNKFYGKCFCGVRTSSWSTRNNWQRIQIHIGRSFLSKRELTKFTNGVLRDFLMKLNKFEKCLKGCSVFKPTLSIFIHSRSRNSRRDTKFKRSLLNTLSKFKHWWKIRKLRLTTLLMMTSNKFRVIYRNRHFKFSRIVNWRTMTSLVNNGKPLPSALKMYVFALFQFKRYHFITKK